MGDASNIESTSFGVVQRFEEQQQSGLLARADQALYRSKVMGKNVICG
jgi:PleD family two-component response regulator